MKTNPIMAEELKSKTNQVRKYGLDRPSREYAITSLTRFLGEEKAEKLWASACETCGASKETSDLYELEKIFKYLSKEGGAVGVLGRSLVIRTVSYRTLNAKG